MRLKIVLALLLFVGLGGVCHAQANPLASPYSNSVFKPSILTGSGQTGAIIQLNALTTLSSTVGSSFASGTITLTGTSLTTVTFALQGSADNGATYFPLPLFTVASPSTPPTTVITATANGLYQVSLGGLTHVRFVSSGTFTATSISLTLTASPNALVSRSSSGGGSGATTPATASLYKGNGSVNGVIAATPGTDYVIPSGTVAAATALAGSPVQCPAGQAPTGILPSGNATGCEPVGSGTPAAGTVNQAQFNSGDGTFAASKATLDAVGNFKSLSLDGAKMAFLNQTTPTSNDGIAKALATPSSLAIAGPDYANVEYQSYGLTRPPAFFGTGSLLVPTVPNIGDATSLIDMRPMDQGRLDYNPTAIQQGAPTVYDLAIHDRNGTAGYLDYQIYAKNVYNFCCGMPSSSNGLWGTVTPFFHNFIDNTQNISGMASYQMAHNGIDDTHLLQLLLHCNGGAITGSDEGCGLERLRSEGDNAPFFGALQSPVNPGNNVFPITPNGQSNQPGEGRPAIDLTAADTPTLVTNVSSTGYPNPIALTIIETITTPDIKCSVSSAAIVNAGQMGQTTASTFSVTGCTGTIVTTSPACIASRANIQSVKVTSGGTASISATLYNALAIGDILYQGPHSCFGAIVNANTNGIHRDILRIAGCPSSHQCDGVEIAAGVWSSGLNGSFSLSGLGTATLTRDGSGVVSALTPTTDSVGLFVGSKLIITSATDATYNGTFTVLSDDGASPNTTITWSNPGTAGSTTTSAVSYLQASNQQGAANSITLVPAVTIVQAENPVTRQNNGTLVSQEHGWTGASGDLIVQDSLNENKATLVHASVVNVTSPSPSGSQGLVGQLQIVGPGDGDSAWDIQVVAGSNGIGDYQNFGGTRPRTFGLFRTRASDPIFNNYFAFQSLPANTGGVISFADCGMTCSSKFAFTSIEKLPAASSLYNRVWHADTSCMTTAYFNGSFSTCPSTIAMSASSGSTSAGFLVDSTGTGVDGHIFNTSNDARFSLLPGSFITKICKPGGFTGCSNFSLLPGSFITTVCDPSGLPGCSHFTQTKTAASVDVPFSAPSVSGNTLQVNNSITNAPGMQVATGPGCTTGAAVLSVCVATINLSPAEPDTAYSVVGCTITPVNGIIGNIGAGPTTTTFQVAEYAGSATGATGGTISCLVVHN